MITLPTPTITPPSNTGLNSQEAFEVGIDWLDFTLRNVGSLAIADAAIAHLEKLTGDCIDFNHMRPAFNGRTWEGSGRGIKGTLLWYDSIQQDAMGRNVPAQLKVALNASVLAGCDATALVSWLRSIAEPMALDCTRIDIALDDRDRIVDMAHIIEARKRGDFFNASWSKVETSNKRGDNEGTTCYFGSPQSAKRLRVYDKEVESSRKRLGIRWECELRKQKAAVALHTLFTKFDEHISEAETFLKGVVVGCIDFRNRRADDPNRNRCPRLPWFGRFIRAVSAKPVAIRVAAVTQTAQKAIDWVIASVAPSLAMLNTIMGEDFPRFVETTIQNGGERLSPIKRKILRRQDKQQLCY